VREAVNVGEGVKVGLGVGEELGVEDGLGGGIFKRLISLNDKDRL
jgi:hypothetical protein